MFIRRNKYYVLQADFHKMEIEISRLLAELKHKAAEVDSITQQLGEMKEERDAERDRAERAVDSVLQGSNVGPISDPLRTTGKSLEALMREGDSMHGEDPEQLKQLLKEAEEDGIEAVLEKYATDKRDVEDE